MNLAVAVGDLTNVAVNTDGVAIVNGVFCVDPVAVRGVPALALAPDHPRDRLAIRIRVAGAGKASPLLAPPVSRT